MLRCAVAKAYLLLHGDNRRNCQQRVPARLIDFNSPIPVSANYVCFSASGESISVSGRGPDEGLI